MANGFRNFFANPAVADFGFALLANSTGRSFTGAVGQAGLLANRSAQERRRNAAVNALTSERIQTSKEARQDRARQREQSAALRERLSKLDLNKEPRLLGQDIAQIGLITGDAGIVKQGLGLLGSAGKASDFQIIRGDAGGVFQVNKLTGEMKQLPGTSEGALPQQLIPVQGVGPEGLPITQFVNPASRERFTVDRGGVPSSAAERKTEAQRDVALGNLERLEVVVRDNAFLETTIGPAEGRKLRARAALPSVGGFGGISEPEAELLSLEEGLSNQLLAAIRGAQVGPAEQVKFEKQLPRIDQQPELFAQNLKRTKDNLKLLQKRARELQGRKKRFTFNPVTGELE